jgi:hypothetical protein
MVAEPTVDGFWMQNLFSLFFNLTSSLLARDFFSLHGRGDHLVLIKERKGVWGASKQLMVSKDVDSDWRVSLPMRS